MREIRHTPIPTAVHTRVGDHEEVQLICRECDLRVHAEGERLARLATLIDIGHRSRHRSTQQATP